MQYIATNLELHVIELLISVTTHFKLTSIDDEECRSLKLPTGEVLYDPLDCEFYTMNRSYFWLLFFTTAGKYT